MTSKNQQKQKKQKKARFPWWIPAAGIAVVLALTLGGFVGMLKLEETDTFCASCHTQPESTFVERMGKEAVDQASAHQSDLVRGAKSPGGTHCIDCHSGPGLGGRAAALMTGAHNAFLYITKTMVQPARLPAPLPDENCLKCHQDILASEQHQGKDNHFHAFLPRWKELQPDQGAHCVDCHTAHTINGEPQLGFLNKERTVAVCDRCHTNLGEGGEGN